jgi:hypothetical protein
MIMRMADELVQSGPLDSQDHLPRADHPCGVLTPSYPGYLIRVHTVSISCKIITWVLLRWFKTYGKEGQRGCITKEYSYTIKTRPPVKGGQISTKVLGANRELREAE